MRDSRVYSVKPPLYILEAPGVERMAAEMRPPAALRDASAWLQVMQAQGKHRTVSATQTVSERSFRRDEISTAISRIEGGGKLEAILNERIGSRLAVLKVVKEQSCLERSMQNLDVANAEKGSTYGAKSTKP